MLAPERRTRGDLAVAAAIVVAIVVAATLIWLHSDARGTTSITAGTPIPVPAAAVQVPDRLAELWHAPDGAIDAPLTVDGAVVTADDGTVTGRDPQTGNALWSYQRNMPLCGVASAWHSAIAVYRDRRGCSQVTALDGATGLRKGHRTSEADDSVHVTFDGTYVMSQGPTRLELWRYDLVRTIEYGHVDAPVNSHSQPRSGCDLLSAASSSSRLTVLERCPDEPALRLTILNPAPKDSQKPEEYGSSTLTNIVAAPADVRVLAVSGDRTAVYIDGGSSSGPVIATYDGSGKAVAQFPLTAPLAPNATIEKVGVGFTLWTGTQLVALRSDFAPIWAINGALGPGVLMAASVLVPIPGAIAVVDPVTGQLRSQIPLDRKGTETTPITMAVLGNVVLEQRGKEVFALGS
ncbi:PQQ-binding-like beta-propeller repeat protein [Antrihabitans stalactiti]|uniref:Pyrrolo-quinoline quinone repeat domain-containing protein n=1 Tax=Antrihabitans stalactiti TaxID=2584121 RepID=A0A848KAW5_9NOCA|nr:hypothetical protein [Antrihabitans stalactiti]